MIVTPPLGGMVVSSLSLSLSFSLSPDRPFTYYICHKRPVTISERGSAEKTGGGGKGKERKLGEGRREKIQ